MVLVAVGVDPCPDERDAAGGTVADPLLLSAEDPVVSVTAGDRLERDRIGAVVRLGQSEGGGHLEARDREEPALLLRLAAEEGERAESETALDRENRAERTVAARHLHVHESCRQRREVRQPGVVDAVVQEVEPTEAFGDVEG